MKLVDLFKVVRVLLIIGMVVSAACLFIPFVTRLSPEKVSAGGQLAAATAAIFGLVVASLALFAYINREEVGRTQADQAWHQKQQLDQALHQFGSLIQIAYSTTHGKIGEEYERLLHPALVMLMDSLIDARKSDLYRALSSLPTDAPGKPFPSDLLLFFEVQIRASLHSHLGGIDSSLFRYYNYLVQALSTITKQNIYQRAHFPLGGNITSFMREAADSIDNPR